MTRFLERWSRLKRGDAAAAEPVAPVMPATSAVQGTDAPAAAPTDDAGSPVSPVEAALPPIDSLDLAADFSAFMKKEVSESLRRAALRKLFSDPHFHFERMDKLDIYIDDYSGSDPIPPDMLQKLRQFETLLKDEDAEATTPDAHAAAAQQAEEAAPGESPTGAPAGGEQGDPPGQADGDGAVPADRA